MSLPQSLLDLYFDCLVLPMDAKIAYRFDYKFRQYSITKIDPQELLDNLHCFPRYLPRTVIFIRPFNQYQPPELYQRALRLMIQLNHPHIQVTDVVFEEMFASCIQHYNYCNESAAELQHLDKKIIENHFLQLISPSLQLPDFQLNASVNTFVLAVQDYQHRYAPRYSDQLKTTTKPVQMHHIVPVQFHRGSSFYSPVYLLPPLCDDPTNPYFYINDCKYLYNYRDQPNAVPCPRLVINAFGLLPAEEGIMKKNEDLVRTAYDLAYVYASLENGYYLASHALCGIIYQNISHLQYIIKLLQEQIQIVRNGKIDYRKEDFLVNLNERSKFQPIQNLEQFDEPYLDLKEIHKNEQGQFKQFIKQTINIYYSALDAITNGYLPEIMRPQTKKQSLSQIEIDYLKKTLAIDAVELEFTAFAFLCKFVQNGEMDPRILLDWDEFGIVLATNLRVIIFKCFLSGYFNRKLEKNKAFYDQMKDVRLLYNTPMAKMRVELKEFNAMYTSVQVKQYQKEMRSFPISQYAVALVFYALNDPIVIRPQNQPDIRDSVIVVYKNGRNFLSSDYIQMYCYLLRINKKLKDRDPPALSTKQNINFYIPTNVNYFDSYYEYPETPEERIKQSKLAEDITNGKCSICQNTSQCMYNNYRDHIYTQFHKDRYRAQLDGIYQNLVKEAQETDQICKQRQQISVLCQLLAQRTSQPFAVCAKHINAVLMGLRLVNLMVDVDEEPRANSPTCRTEQFGKWRESVLRNRFEEFESRLAFDLKSSDNRAGRLEDGPQDGSDSGSDDSSEHDPDHESEKRAQNEAKYKPRTISEQDVELDSVVIACAWQIYQRGINNEILQRALLDLIRQYGTLDDIVAVNDMLDKKALNGMAGQASGDSSQVSWKASQEDFVPLADVYKKQFTGLNDIVQHSDLYAELINQAAMPTETQDTDTPEDEADSEKAPQIGSFASLTKEQFEVFQDYAKHQLNLLLSPYEDLQFEDLFFKTLEDIKNEEHRLQNDQNASSTFLSLSDVKDLRYTIYRYENGLNYDSLVFQKLVRNISFYNNSSLASVLTKEQKLSFCAGRLVIPPFYQRNPDYIDMAQLLEIASGLKNDKQNAITLSQLVQTCREYSSDLELMLDFVANSMHFDYSTEDDSAVDYSYFSAKLVQEKARYEFSGLQDKFFDQFQILDVRLNAKTRTYPRLIRSNSFDGALDRYCLTSLTSSKSSCLNPLLTTDLPHEDLSWPYQARESSDDNDFSVSLTQIQGSPAPPVHTFETSKDCWNDIIRGFDFAGETPTFENVNVQALEAIAALLQTQTGFSEISGAANFAYDSAISGCITGVEDFDVIYGCAAARMSSSSQHEYEEVPSGSFTVQRRVVGGGLFG